MTVDMEYTALATVCYYCGLKFAALIAISDKIYGDKPLLGLSKGAFQTSLKKGSELILMKTH